MSQKPVFFLNGESHVEKKLFPHQKDAVDKLRAYYKGDDYKEELGWKPHILVMPTGAGKTFTANSLIIPHMLEKGYKVLWLAHRVMLLGQAAQGMKELRAVTSMILQIDQLELFQGQKHICLQHHLKQTM